MASRSQKKKTNTSNKKFYFFFLLLLLPTKKNKTHLLMSKNKEQAALLKKFKNVKSSKGSFLQPNEDPIAYFTLKVEILDQQLLMNNADKIFDFSLRNFFAHKRYLVLNINEVCEVIVINPIRDKIESIADAENHKHVFRIPLGEKCFAEGFKSDINLFYHDGDMNSVYQFGVDNLKNYNRGNGDNNSFGLYYFDPLSVKLSFEWHLAGPVWLKLMQGNMNFLQEWNATESLLLKDFKFDFQKELVQSDEFMNALFRRTIDFWVRDDQSEKDTKWRYSTILRIFWQQYLKLTPTTDVKFYYFDEIFKLYQKNSNFSSFIDEHIFGYFVPFDPCNWNLVLFFLFDREKKKQLRKVLKEGGSVEFEKTVNYLVQNQSQTLLSVILYRTKKERNGFIHFFFRKFANILAPIIEKNEELINTCLGTWNIKKINPTFPEEENKYKGNASYIHNLLFSPEFTSLPLKLVGTYDFSLQEIHLNHNNFLHYDSIGQGTKANSIILVAEVDGFDVAFTKFVYIVRSQCGWLEFNELGSILVLSSMKKIDLIELKPLLELSKEERESHELKLPEGLITELLFIEEKRAEDFFKCEEVKEIKEAKYFYFIFYENSKKSEILFNSIGALGFRDKAGKLERVGKIGLINPLARVGFEVKKIIRPYI